MGTESEDTLTIRGRATAAGGAAFVAAAIVNPLDVIKTRIQAQAMQAQASTSGPASQTSSQAVVNYCSTLYEHHAAGRALHQCQDQLWHHQHQHQQQHQHLHPHNYAQQHCQQQLLLRYSHSMPPEAAAWIRNIARSHGAVVSRSNPWGPVATSAVTPAIDSAAAGIAAAAARFRRWGITEGPIRRSPYALAGAGPAVSCQCTASASAVARQLPAHSMWETAKHITAKEGLPVLWRGTWASLLIAVPMVGIYMPLYDALLAEWSGKLGSVAPVAAGTAARTAACFCVAPFELLRTRLQAAAGTRVSMRSMLHSFLHDHHHHHQHAPPQQQAAVRPAAIVRAVPRMWTGFSATLVRDVPFSALYWAMVEPLRQAMLPKNSHWHPFWQQQQRQQSSSSSSWSRSNMFRPVHHTQLEILIANMFSGFVAGGLAAGLTTPFDVVKTRMQIAQPGSGSSSSGGGIRVWQVLRDVYHKEGLEGLFTGVKPRAYRAAPACAIVISVYELLKDMLASADVGLAVAQQAAHAG